VKDFIVFPNSEFLIREGRAESGPDRARAYIGTASSVLNRNLTVTSHPVRMRTMLMSKVDATDT
jgi:hypothetical protein